jgi:hypothetical protein
MPFTRSLAASSNQIGGEKQHGERERGKSINQSKI